MDKADVQRALNSGLDDGMCMPCKCKHLVNVKQTDLFSFSCAVISMTACIFTVACTFNCNRVQADLTEHCNNINGENFEAFLTENHFPIQNAKIGHRTNGAMFAQDLPGVVTHISDMDETTATELDKKHIFHPYDRYNSDTGKQTSEERKQLRIRRAVTTDLKTCRKNCKGTRYEKRKCKRECKKSYGTTRTITRIMPTQVNLPAAHFEANVMDIHTQDLVENVYTDFKSRDEGPLQVFKQSEWVGSTSPVELTKHSVAVVKTSGIYFVYAQVFIGGHGTEKSVSVVHRKDERKLNDKLSCYNGDNNRALPEQTCSVFGLMKLDQGDTIEVQRSIATKDIELDKDKTFFGLVQLSGIVLK